MQELLLGSWGPQIVAFTRQHPLEVVAAVTITISMVITPMFLTRGSGSDVGGCNFGDGDGGGCGGD